MTPAAVLLLLIVVCSSASPAPAPPDTAKVIDRIVLRNRSVFDPEIPRYTRFPYPLLNHLHIKTRARVIRQELLFKPGERFDPKLAEESARNLRKFPFLGHVSIVPLARADSVDVVVTTEDQWTTNPDVVIDRRGNLSRWGIGLEEENFLGLGKAFRVRFLTSTDRNLWRVIYDDRDLLDTHWTLKLTGIRADDGKLVEGRMARPLYTLSAHWSFDGGYRYEHAIDRLYDDGLLSAEVGTRRQAGNLSLTRAWNSGTFRPKLALNLVGETRMFEDRINFSRPSAPSAQNLLAEGLLNRRDLRAEMTWGIEHAQFVRKRFIDRAGLVEDIRVGPSVSVTAGWAEDLREVGDSYSPLSASVEEATAIGDSHLIFLSAEGGAHVEGGRINNGALTAFYHHYYQGLPGQTLVFGAAYLRAWRVDQPFQLVLGEDVGLRGYPARQFTGDRLLLLNFEDRIFTPVDFATFRLGFAAFCDAGMAWRPGQPERWKDLRTSAGVSLRLGFVKFSEAPILRFDLAFPFRPVPGGSRYSIGFSFSPIFWLRVGPDAVVKRLN